MEKHIWQLPVNGAERTGNGYIPSSAKYHCFNGNISLCGRFTQITSNYDDGISANEKTIAENPQIACKVCYRKLKIIKGELKK